MSFTLMLGSPAGHLLNGPPGNRVYHLRACTEERHRQGVFVMLAYYLFQIYLLHRGRAELNSKTLPHIRHNSFCLQTTILLFTIRITTDYLLRLNSWAWG
jgi:hypothetical protein